MDSNEKPPHESVKTFFDIFERVFMKFKSPNEQFLIRFLRNSRGDGNTALLVLMVIELFHLVAPLRKVPSAVFIFLI